MVEAEWEKRNPDAVQALLSSTKTGVCSLLVTGPKQNTNKLLWRKVTLYFNQGYNFILISAMCNPFLEHLSHVMTFIRCGMKPVVIVICSLCWLASAVFVFFMMVLVNGVVIWFPCSPFVEGVWCGEQSPFYHYYHRHQTYMGLGLSMSVHHNPLDWDSPSELQWSLHLLNAFSRPLCLSHCVMVPERHHSSNISPTYCLIQLLPTCLLVLKTDVQPFLSSPICLLEVISS